MAKAKGYAGRKPARFAKHEAWAGVQLDTTKTTVLNGSIKKVSNNG